MPRFVTALCCAAIAAVATAAGVQYKHTEAFVRNGVGYTKTQLRGTATSDQPKEIILAVTQFCKGPMTVVGQSAVQCKFVENVTAVDSGFGGGFGVVPLSGHTSMNASITYALTSGKLVQLAVQAQMGEWGLSVSCPNDAGLVMNSMEIAQRQVYTVSIGFPHYPYPLC